MDTGKLQATLKTMGCPSPVPEIDHCLYLIRPLFWAQLDGACCCFTILHSVALRSCLAFVYGSEAWPWCVLTMAWLLGG